MVHIGHAEHVVNVAQRREYRVKDLQFFFQDLVLGDRDLLEDLEQAIQVHIELQVLFDR